MSLEPGLTHTHDFVVEGQLLTDVRGTLPTAVLSTPAMVGLMEFTSVNAIMEHYPPETASVGFEVCIKHVAAAPQGSTVTVSSTLRGVQDGRKLFFDVECREGDRVIGTGTHQRRLVGPGVTR